MAACDSQKDQSEWKVYGGSKANTHYSSLKEIDTANVSQLQVAWEYHTGDADTAKQFMALDESVTARADLSSQDRSTQAEAAQTTYDSWVESHLMASDSAKAAMLGKLLADAAACAALVPPAPDTETVLPK